MVNFSGVLTDVNGKPLTGAVGVTFYLYKDAEGGAPLWMETQNVKADKAGHYTAALGSTSSQGLPANVFASGEARWLGVQAQGQKEQPRVLLMSVPYALKALDAETIGGKPASSFMLAPTASGRSSKAAQLPPGTITGKGTAGFIPVFTGATTIADSKIFQTVGLNVGVGTATPAAKLDVAGTDDVRDTLTLFPKSTHPTLSVHGTAFAVSSTGKVTFVAGQTFPGTGTVTSVGSGLGLTGGPITTSGTLKIDTAVVPQLAGANSFTNVNAISVSSGSPALTIANGSGDAIDMATGNIGVNVTSGAQGIHAVTSGDAGVFEGGFDGSYNLGPSSGVYSESDTDSSFNSATIAFEFGGTTRTQGIWAFSASPAGVGAYGELVVGASAATPYDGTSGVWGDSSGSVGVNGTSDSAYGVVGVTADTNAGGYAGGIFVNDSSAAGTIMYAYAPNVGGLCSISNAGHLSCNGSLGAVAPVDGGARKVALSAIQAPENWFEDAGAGQLSNGEAIIHLEPIFGETINTGVDYHVFLTPNGEGQLSC